MAMVVLCSPSSEAHEFAMYDVQKVNNNFYQATLKKFTGDKNNFPGVFLLWRNPGDWITFPEGHSSLVGCLVQELEKWVY
ncbi:MAG TPA: hypothetical protein VGD17_01695 [Chitinophagaceae bacterium]